MALVRTCLVLLALAVMPLPARAQSPLAGQIRIVVPYPPGGPTDAVARILARELQAASGRTTFVENKPGASGAIGSREVARAAPDGATLEFSTNQTHSTNAFLLKEPGYDPQKDFVPIAGVGDLQHALVVPRMSVAATVADLVALGRREPGKLNYGSTGLGSASHLTMELFQLRTGTRLTHVPFRGAAPMTLEIVAGRIDAGFATLPSVLGQIEGGEMRALALASDHRAPQLPSLPLLAEQGVKDSEGDAWLALFAPAALPMPVLTQLEGIVLAAMRRPDVKDAVTKLGVAVNLRDSKAFVTFLATEMDKWREVVKVAGVKPE